MNRFSDRLKAEGLTLHRVKPAILQVNLGKLRKPSGTHSHLNAGPIRQEIMTRATMDRVIEWLAQTSIPIVDITGGAPEMVPDFRHFVTGIRMLPLTRRIIDRCNLTLLIDQKHAGLAEFLAGKKVELIASIPFHSPEIASAPRDEGVFEASIQALRMLNRLGYGVAGDLPLHLVCNPEGLQLPTAQSQLESDFKRVLASKFGIVFNKLYTMTNVPVGRFATMLRLNNKLEAYMDILINAFDPAKVEGVACRHSINVGWQGEVYDCDFNQQMGMQWRNGHLRFLWEVDPETIAENEIMTADHCFGCTVAGDSSCGGLVS